MRREYQMTDEQRARILDASKPVPAMVLSGGQPMFGTPQENANAAWCRLAEELGFKWDTVQPVAGKPDTFFTAEPEGRRMTDDTDTLERPEAETTDRLTAEQILEAASKIEDGVYFDLEDRIYHAVPRLSCGGLQKMCVSAGTFWRGSWLDPEQPEPDEDATKAQILGRAYHVARLEPHRFEQCYCRKIDKEDFAELAKASGACWNGKEIEAQLEKLGQPKKFKDDTGVASQGARLKKAGYKGVIWPLEQARFEDQLNGRIAIEAKYFDDLVRDQERLLGNPEVAALFEGGQSEVSVFWTDEHGIKMKSRIDRLAADRIVDLKTFDNSRGKVLGQAIADAVRYNRYYIQPVVYGDAVAAIRDGIAPIRGEATEEQHKLVAQIRLSKASAFWFVFQEKNGVPNLLARKFIFHGLDAYRETEVENLVEEGRQDEVKEAMGRKSGIYQRALMDIDRAKREFVKYSQMYRPGVPWSPPDPMGTIDDLDFADSWLEGKYF